MSSTSARLCLGYAVIALLALYGTWSQNLHYFGDLSPAGTLDAFGAFTLDLKANPATRSITFDILAFLLAANVWMIYEARRLGIRYVWAYIVLAFLVAISVTFPLFMIARERRLVALRPADAAAPVGTGDSAALAILVVVVAALGVYTLW